MNAEEACEMMRLRDELGIARTALKDGAETLMLAHRIVNYTILDRLKLEDAAQKLSRVLAVLEKK